VEKSFNFSLDIISFAEKLKVERKYELASQLFKSWTSIGANVRKAQNAESPADFIHKFKIAAKEAEETNYWLELSSKSEFLPNPQKIMISDLDVIMKIISKILSTSKKKW